MSTPPTPDHGAVTPRRPALRSFHTPLAQRTKSSAQSSPAYLVAGFLHLVLLLILSFWTVAVYVTERVRTVEAKIATSNEVVIKQVDKQEAVKAPGDEALEETAPELDVDSAYQEASGKTKGSLSDDAAAVFGSGSQSGFGRGGNRNSKGGPSTASEGSIRLSLEWLIKHQAADGGWADLPATHQQTGRLPVHGDIARTGLALLCFISADIGPSKESPYKAKLERARDWLIQRVKADGDFQHRAQGEGTKIRPGWPTANYNHAIGTLALSELLQRQSAPGLRPALARAVGWITANMNAQGWRYRGQNHADTSVTGWMILALKSAEQNKISLERTVYARVRAYLEKASKPDGTTGYLISGGGSIGMSATGLFLRVVLGEPANSPRNRAAAVLVEGQGKLTLSGRGRRSCGNLYQLYYSALALYQAGGPLWESFNPRIRDSLIKAQIRGDEPKGIRSENPECERGSWRPAGYCRQDQVLSTCFAALILETYYRYLRPGEEGRRFSDPVLDPEKGVTAGQKLLRAAVLAFNAAKASKQPGELLGAEAALARAAKRLAGEAPPRSQDLVHYARVRLVELAGVAGDQDAVLSRSQEYLHGLPTGRTPDPGVLRLRRLALVKQLARSAAATLKSGTEPQRRRALKQVQALDAELEAQRIKLDDPDHKAEVGRLQELLASLEAGLNLALDPDGEVARRANLLQQTSTAKAPTTRELRLLRTLLVQSIHAFLDAAKNKNPGGLTKGAAHLRIVSSRRLPQRLDKKALAPIARLEERARALFVHALAVHERHDDTRAAAGDFVQRFPTSSLRLGVEQQLLAALAHRIRSGDGTPADRKQVIALAVRNQGRGKSDQPLAIAELLTTCAAYEESIPYFRRALEQTPRGELAVRARLGLVRAARLTDDITLADQQLTGFSKQDSQRFQVRMERAAVLRCRSKFKDALAEYFAVLRALKTKRPPQWWDAAEQVANTYLDQGKVPAARTYLAELIATDRSMGTPAHKRRLLALVNEVDVWRPGRAKPRASMTWGAR